MKYCTHCGAEVPQGAAVCLKCGFAVNGKSSEVKFCGNCGSNVDTGAAICLKCGFALAENKSDKDWITVLLLAIFLGGIGIHQFYVGNNKKGILMLLFCWTFVPAIFALVDIIKIIQGKFKDSNGKIVAKS
ncbi:MAG: TM2 domain-containing protein [Spirochaetaceae bacterium]|jgi:TM2 domain-containing membrane protein YozV/ribosomal protein L40E|nr:TM2 domain-containing protein [Spirochaetaceae bacterium]